MAAARACGSGSPASVRRSSAALPKSPAPRSGASGTAARVARRPSGSTGAEVAAQMMSTARLRVMVLSQAWTEPRGALSPSACRRAWSNVCWATSSAMAVSPTTVIATPKTSPWKRRTNASDSSSSPAPRPASSVSSGSWPASVPAIGLCDIRGNLILVGPPASSRAVRAATTSGGQSRAPGAWCWCDCCSSAWLLTSGSPGK